MNNPVINLGDKVFVDGSTYHVHDPKSEDTCYYCGSRNIESISGERNGSIYEMEYECLDCEQVFGQRYLLTFIHTISMEDSNE